MKTLSQPKRRQRNVKFTLCCVPTQSSNKQFSEKKKLNLKGNVKKDTKSNDNIFHRLVNYKQETVCESDRLSNEMQSLNPASSIHRFNELRIHDLRGTRINL